LAAVLNARFTHGELTATIGLTELFGMLRTICPGFANSIRTKRSIPIDIPAVSTAGERMAVGSRARPPAAPQLAPCTTARWRKRTARRARRFGQVLAASNEIERSLPPPVVHLTVATPDVHRAGGRVAFTSCEGAPAGRRLHRTSADRVRRGRGALHRGDPAPALARNASPLRYTAGDERPRFGRSARC
jgi:hypothetical protein